MFCTVWIIPFKSVSLTVRLYTNERGILQKWNRWSIFSNSSWSFEELNTWFREAIRSVILWKTFYEVSSLAGLLWSAEGNHSATSVVYSLAVCKAQHVKGKFSKLGVAGHLANSGVKMHLRVRRKVNGWKWSLLKSRLMIRTVKTKILRSSSPGDKTVC